MTTVLIVDDEPDIVLFARMTLESAGYDILEAGDGEAALAAVYEHRPDAVLLDVMLPLIDGWTVLERLKADPDERIRTIPVVMLTALSGPVDEVRGGIEGAVAYLAKPVTPDAIVDAVQQAVAGEPEPVQRRSVQQHALERLARMERVGSGAVDPAPGPRPRLGRLERSRSAPASTVGPPGAPPTVLLTDVQRVLLRTLRTTASVSEAADALGMSRSNVYATLRRVGRKVAEPDVAALLRRLRAGELDATVDG